MNTVKRKLAGPAPLLRRGRVGARLASNHKISRGNLVCKWFSRGHAPATGRVVESWRNRKFYFPASDREVSPVVVDGRAARIANLTVRGARSSRLPTPGVEGARSNATQSQMQKLPTGRHEKSETGRIGYRSSGS